MTQAIFQRRRHLALYVALVLALAYCIAIPNVQALASPSASAGQNSSVPKAGPVELGDICTADAVQSIAAKLDIKVTVAEIPDGPQLLHGTAFVAASGNLPAYCRVTGSFVTNPKTGKTANFLATLPANWNHKYLQIGCFTHCGGFIVNDVASPVAWIVDQGLPGEAIQKGYASFATDEGHTGQALASWAVKGPGEVDQDAIDDFYYRADEVLARMGKAYTDAFYTQATGKAQEIAYSYLIGCSGGGRDALIAATFFPQYFDGIVAGSPYTYMPGAALQGPGITLAHLRSKDAELSPALMNRVDSIVKAQCDVLDGVKDGLIQNPAACNFQPARDLPRCTAGASSETCFSEAQIQTISTMVTAITDEHGKVVQPGFTVSDLQDVNAPPVPPEHQTDAALQSETDWLEDSGAGAIYKVFTHKDAPDFHTRSLYTFGSGGKGQVTAYRIIVPMAEVDRAAEATYMGTGVHPDVMGKFLKTNRRLLIWANLSDPLLTPYMSINYYKQLAGMYGGYDKLQKNIRLFLLPDTAHCSMDGCGPTSFDAISAIERWVEDGKAPDSLIAAQYESKKIPQIPVPIVNYQKVLRTMPLCKFPEMAHYSGTGDVMDSANWSCPANDESMLKVGESGRQAGVLQ